MSAISTNALMERLHLKYHQKPWNETVKLVHFCMDKPLQRPLSDAPDGLLLSCMEKIQRTLNAKSLVSVMNRLESLSKQKGLNAHVSPCGTACYITSDMFYIEVQLEKNGNVTDVKLAHLGEAPVVCDDLVQHLRSGHRLRSPFRRSPANMIKIAVTSAWKGKVCLLEYSPLCDCSTADFCKVFKIHLSRMKNYAAFGKILEDLTNLYQIPGNSEMRAKGYLALQALEKDLHSLSLLDRTQDVNRVTEVLHGKVGHLVPRTGGTPISIEFYISPYQVLEAELNPGSQVCGTKTVVTVEGTDTLHRLPLSPLLVDPQAGENGNPAFLPLSDELSMDLSAFFVLKFHQPIPLSSSSIEEIQRLTGIQITGLKLASLYELIVQCTLKEKCSEDLSPQTSWFFVNRCQHGQVANFSYYLLFSPSNESLEDILAKRASPKKVVMIEGGTTYDAPKRSQSLPDCPKHCYFINKGSENSDLVGALVSKIPFSHPKCVPGVIEILRHQVAYNSLISSCISEKHVNEDASELLYFEVLPHKNTSISVFFLHPMKENLACVIIDVRTSREVQCHLYLNPQDPTLNSSDDFITRALKRCMSVPVVMRAIFKNAAKVKADSETQDMEADTKQKPEPTCEQVTDSNSPEESLSVAGPQDLVVTDEPSITDSPKENLSTAKLETPGDNTEKSNPIASTETLCRVEETDATGSRETVMTDK